MTGLRPLSAGGAGAGQSPFSDCVRGSPRATPQQEYKTRRVPAHTHPTPTEHRADVRGHASALPMLAELASAYVGARTADVIVLPVMIRYRHLAWVWMAIPALSSAMQWWDDGISRSSLSRLSRICCVTESTQVSHGARTQFVRLPTRPTLCLVV